MGQIHSYCMVWIFDVFAERGGCQAISDLGPEIENKSLLGTKLIACTMSLHFCQPATFLYKFVKAWYTVTVVGPCLTTAGCHNRRFWSEE